MADVVVAGFARATTTYQRGLGHFDMVRLAVALELYRHEHGDYPKELDALVPKYFAAIPPDAFDGKPLHFEVTEAGLILDSERHHRGQFSADRDLVAPIRFPFPQ
jgi:hypothetical protein